MASSRLIPASRPCAMSQSMSNRARQLRSTLMASWTTISSRATSSNEHASKLTSVFWLTKMLLSPATADKGLPLTLNLVSIESRVLFKSLARQSKHRCVSKLTLALLPQIRFEAMCASSLGCRVSSVARASACCGVCKRNSQHEWPCPHASLIADGFSPPV